MKPISREQILEQWDRLCEMDEEQTTTLVERFMEEQPALGIFLFANIEDQTEDADDSPLIDLVIACWQTMSQAAGGPLKTVSSEEIEQAETANTEQLEALEEASEIQWEGTVRKSFEEYPQRELLGFGIEVLMSGQEEAPELAPERIGMEMLWLKTVIDCLDRS